MSIFWEYFVYLTILHTGGTMMVQIFQLYEFLYLFIDLIVDTRGVYFPWEIKNLRIKIGKNSKREIMTLEK